MGRGRNPDDDGPRVAFGVVQDGKVVHAGGVGVREVGKNEKPDADMVFLLAGSTKPLTTLMLAKLVEEKKLSWDTAVEEVLPELKPRHLKLRDAVSLSKGPPRFDLPRIFEMKGVTPKSLVKALGKMPTPEPASIYVLADPFMVAAGDAGGRALLGTLAVTSGAKTIFDFGEWKTEVGTRKNADGTISFVMVDPGVAPLSSYHGFTASTSEKRTLVVHEEKSEYVFTEE